MSTVAMLLLSFATTLSWVRLPTLWGEMIAVVRAQDCDFLSNSRSHRRSSAIVGVIAAVGEELLEMGGEICIADYLFDARVVVLLEQFDVATKSFIAGNPGIVGVVPEADRLGEIDR